MNIKLFLTNPKVGCEATMNTAVCLMLLCLFNSLSSATNKYLSSASWQDVAAAGSPVGWKGEAPPRGAWAAAGRNTAAALCFRVSLCPAMWASRAAGTLRPSSENERRKRDNFTVSFSFFFSFFFYKT